jgi:hypothetical protein
MKKKIVDTTCATFGPPYNAFTLFTIALTPSNSPFTKIMPTHFATLGQTCVVTTKYIIHEPLN